MRVSPGGYITLNAPHLPFHLSPITHLLPSFGLSLSPCRPLSLPSPPPCSHHLNVRVAVVIHLLFSLELHHLLLLLLLLLLFLLQFNPSCFSLVLLLRSFTFFFLLLMLLLRQLLLHASSRRISAPLLPVSSPAHPTPSSSFTYSSFRPSSLFLVLPLLLLLLLHLLLPLLRFLFLIVLHPALLFLLLLLLLPYFFSCSFSCSLHPSTLFLFLFLLLYFLLFLLILFL